MKKLLSAALVSFIAIFGTVALVQAQVVVSGDTLWKIARQAGISLPQLLAINPQISNPDLIYPGQNINVGGDYLPEEKIGASTSPVAGVTYNLAGSGITGSATSIILQSLTIPQSGRLLLDADFSDTFYITLEPGNTKRQEISSCTTVVQNANGTATLSGCSRGLVPFTPFTASTTYQFSHGGGTQVIFSDPPQLFNEFTAKLNKETISRVWTFEVHPEASSTLGVPTTSLQYATKAYADSLTFTGAPDSSLTQKGLVERATGQELASSTPLGNTTAPLVPSSLQTTSSPYTTGNVIPVTQFNGQLDAVFINTSSPYQWTGSSTFTNNVYFGGNVTSTNVTSTQIGATVVSTTALFVNSKSATPIFGVSSTDAGSLHYHPTSSMSGIIQIAVNNTTPVVIPHLLGVRPTTITFFATAVVDSGGTIPGLAVSFGTASSTDKQSSIQGSLDCAANCGAGTRGFAAESAGNVVILSDAGGATDFTLSTSAWNATSFTVTPGTNVNAGGTRFIMWVANK